MNSSHCLWISAGTRKGRRRSGMAGACEKRCQQRLKQVCRCLLLVASALFLLIPLAIARQQDDSDVAERSVKTNPAPMFTIEQILAPQQPSSDPLVCDEALKLVSKLAIGKGNPPTLFVTIHGGNRRHVYHCDRVTIWKLEGDRFRQIRVWESSGGADDLRLFHFNGDTFLHFRMTSPSAGHEWVVDKLLYVAPDYTLHDVGIDRTTRCGKMLPPLNNEESEYGASYTFADSGMRFERFGVLPGDSPASDKGVVYSGAVAIRGVAKRDPKTGQYTTTFTLYATGCKIEED